MLPDVRRNKYREPIDRQTRQGERRWVGPCRFAWLYGSRSTDADWHHQEGWRRPRAWWPIQNPACQKTSPAKHTNLQTHHLRNRWQPQLKKLRGDARTRIPFFMVISPETGTKNGFIVCCGADMSEKKLIFSLVWAKVSLCVTRLASPIEVSLG